MSYQLLRNGWMSICCILPTRKICFMTTHIQYEQTLSLKMRMKPLTIWGTLYGLWRKIYFMSDRWREPAYRGNSKWNSKRKISSYQWWTFPEYKSLSPGLGESVLLFQAPSLCWWVRQMARLHFILSRAHLRHQANFWSSSSRRSSQGALPGIASISKKSTPEPSQPIFLA